MRLSTSERMQWMDVLRGVAIILVIAWHAPAIPQLLGARLPDWLLAANDFFLPYRMPTLMFLSGLLLPSALRKPLARYYWGKLQLVVWPYLIWSGLHLVQMDSDESILHWRSWIATGYLWFIFFIACYYAVAPLLARLPVWLVPGVALASTFVLPDGLPLRLAYFAVFFFAGAAVSRSPRILTLIGSTWWVAVPAGTAAIGFGVISAFQRSQLEGVTVPLSMCGIVAAIVCARRVEHARWLRPIRFIGRNSLVFYVAHFPVILAAWMLLPDVLTADLAVASLVLFVIAMSACWGLAILQRHRPVGWLFRAPHWLPQRPGTPAVPGGVSPRRPAGLNR